MFRGLGFIGCLDLDCRGQGFGFGDRVVVMFGALSFEFRVLLHKISGSWDCKVWGLGF